MARKRERDTFGALERAYDMFEQAGRHGEGHHSLAEIARDSGGTRAMRARGRGRGDLGGPGSPRASIVGAVASLAASSPPGGALSRSVGAPIPASIGGAPAVTPRMTMGRPAGSSAPAGGVTQGAAPAVITPPRVFRPVAPPIR